MIRQGSQSHCLIAAPRISSSAVILSLLALSACSPVGPQTVPRDRLDYSVALDDSWKRQILLNVIRIRYMDPPSFVDVGQIVSGYTLETGVAGVGQAGSGDLGGNFGSIGGHATFTDRPTITYTPLTGSSYLRGLMTPIAPEAIFYTIDSGWPADVIMQTGVSSINGLKNGETTIAGFRPPDPKFVRVAQLMRKIENSGAVGLKVVVDKEKHTTNIISLHSTNMPEETRDDITELRSLLGLNQQASEFQLVYGTTASNDHELAVQTRSLLHIMADLAAHAQVPPEDVRDGRATPGADMAARPTTQPSNPPILYSPTKPKDAFIAVQYRTKWFWVDDCDLTAKRDLAFLMLLFTLANTGEKESLPLITIQAQ
jgi:hypothetical protein